MACPRSSHPARPPPPNHPACPSRDERLLRSGQILEKTLPVVLRLIWAFRPLHTTGCIQRSGRPHPPGSPTRNRPLHGEETENGKRCGGNGSNRGSRSAAHPGTPTRNRTAQRREQGKRQTKRRRWQQRSCGGGRSIVRIRNGVKIMPPAEKRSFFLIFAP